MVYFSDVDRLIYFLVIKEVKTLSFQLEECVTANKPIDLRVSKYIGIVIQL